MPPRYEFTGRRAAAVAGALLVLVAFVLAVRSCGGDGGGAAPPSAAARMVPADTLVYAHFSTDGSRPAVRRALALAGRFPSFPRLRDAVLGRLSRAGAGLSFDRDVRPWLGREAALALLNTPGQTAGSLIVLDVTDRKKADAFLTRVAGTPKRTTYRGTTIQSYGNASAAYIDGDLAIGQPPGLQSAIDAEAGRVPSLARSKVFRRASGGLPSGRVADVFASPAGVARVLASQGGGLGAAGALLDQPTLQGVSLAVTPQDKGVRLTIHSALDAAAGRRLPRAKPFQPKLVGSVPPTAMAYLGVTRLDRAAGRLLAAGLAGGGGGRRITQLLARLRGDLGRRAGVNLQRDVLPLFQGEVALWLAPSVPAPVLTIIAATDNEGRTREAFARLQPALARLLAPSGGGQVPTFTERQVDGVPAFQLRIGPGIELDYAVFDGKLVVSTSLAGVRAVKRHDGSLADAESFKTALGGRPKEVTSLVFLDFSELLRLAERTGLNDSRAYLAIREDLRKVRALGAAASGDTGESTTELFIEIP
ncbi:MAG: hypothetical protein QOE65_245 [Solirubrobacteraceae bacterium]|jgi:hypothetical protein|nr:hypothetical protein [Solirubrobacteraceae bacterium]